MTRLLNPTGDGIPDVLLNNQSGQPFAGGAIQHGNGDGSFQTAVRALDTTATLPCAYVADLNNDQIADILVGHYTFLGNGDATFQSPEGFQASTGCPPLVADVNGDGILDLVEASTAGIRVMLGNGDGSFQPPVDSAYPFPNPPVDSSEVKRIFTYASEEADSPGDAHIETKHLLLGILREKDCVVKEQYD